MSVLLAECTDCRQIDYFVIQPSLTAEEKEDIEIVLAKGTNGILGRAYGLSQIYLSDYSIDEWKLHKD